jgi:hypothetical protein
LVKEAAVGDIGARKHREKGQATNLAAISRLAVQDRGKGGSTQVTQTRGRIQRKTWCMGTYAGADYNLTTLCPLQSRQQHIYHGQPYSRVDLKGTDGFLA